MGIPTLLSTNTADNDSSVDITSNITSAYDEYMFVFTDINPATDGADFTFQFNVAGESGFNETLTTTYFNAYHEEGGSGGALTYTPGSDQAQGTSYQRFVDNVGNGSDESCAGIMHLFTPASTTYVTHFYSRMSPYENTNAAQEINVAGYVNATGAVDEVSFKFDSGNFDGVIQMYGIA